jgi:Leucine-rich repeat (LRR) protein
MMNHFDCAVNQLKELPPLPAVLERLDCVANHLRYLPSLPEGLSFLYCHENPLEILPELPLSLSYLMCDKPFDEYIEMIEATPEEIQHVNKKMQRWREMMNGAS